MKRPHLGVLVLVNGGTVAGEEASETAPVSRVSGEVGAVTLRGQVRH